MTERTEADLQHDLEERLRFETLLAEISARYINLPVDQIDLGIEDDQRRICECQGLDLSALWQCSEETPQFLTVTHLHSPPEGYGPREVISMERFEQSVFPDDLARIRQAITRSLERNDPLSVDYRILTDRRWLHEMYQFQRPSLFQTQLCNI